MKNLFGFIVILLLYSCQSNTEKETVSDQLFDSSVQNTSANTDVTIAETNDGFTEFSKQFTKMNLPISITGRAIDTKKLKGFKPENFKNPQGKSFADWWAYKQINTNGQYLAFITLEYNRINMLIPILGTYTTSGQLIDSKVLDFGWEEYVDYQDSVVINKDFSIYISGISEAVELDENEMEIPGTKKQKLYYRKGKLLNTGEIELSEQFDKVLEK